MYNNKGQIRHQNKQKIIRDKERFYMMIKGQFHKKDIAILNIYAPSKTHKATINRTVVQTNLQLYMVISIPLSKVERITKEKIIKDIEELNRPSNNRI